MNETTVSAVDKSLAMLLKAEKDFPGYSLDFCSGYVSTDGVLLVKKMLKSSPKVRAIVGLNTSNRISAFQMLRDDCGVEVYVYVTRSYMLFHPKIYFGALNAQAWAMIGSSNLTKSGLSSNIEHNLFITGQRHIEPFISIETQIEAYCQQAYLFDTSIEKELRKIEQKLNGTLSDPAYKNLLFLYGIRPKTRLDFNIPLEACQVALETIVSFTENTMLEYAYQMLLLLVMLSRTDENGTFSLEETANCFYEFYKLRRLAGLPIEKAYKTRQAIVDNVNVSAAKIRQMLKNSPFPRFERQGLLDISDDGKYFIINPALFVSLTPTVKEHLRKKAIERMRQHFGEDEMMMEAMIVQAIESTKP
ncbi:MAG: phospholipase D-like domain-containing protein [Ktedonobacteraceae bacterium]